MNLLVYRYKEGDMPLGPLIWHALTGKENQQHSHAHLHRLSRSASCNINVIKLMSSDAQGKWNRKHAQFDYETEMSIYYVDYCLLCLFKGENTSFIRLVFTPIWPFKLFTTMVPSTKMVFL